MIGGELYKCDCVWDITLDKPVNNSVIERISKLYDNIYRFAYTCKSSVVTEINVRHVADLKHPKVYIPDIFLYEEKKQDPLKADVDRLIALIEMEMKTYPNGNVKTEQAGKKWVIRLSEDSTIKSDAYHRVREVYNFFTKDKIELGFDCSRNTSDVNIVYVKLI